MPAPAACEVPPADLPLSPEDLIEFQRLCETTRFGKVIAIIHNGQLEWFEREERTRSRRVRASSPPKTANP